MRTQDLLSHWNIYTRTLAYGSTLTIVSITERQCSSTLLGLSTDLFKESLLETFASVNNITLISTRPPSDCQEVYDSWRSNDLVHCNPVKYDHCHFGHSEHACEVYVMWCWHLYKWGTSRNYDCRESWKSKHDFALNSLIKCSCHGCDLR